MSKHAVNGLLIFAAIIFMALVFEGACRTVLNTGMQYHLEMWRYAVELKRIAAIHEIGHEHKPNARAHLMGVDVEINAQGLRDDDLLASVPKDAVRILMLGDSVTFGWGVSADATMSAVMERELSEFEGRSIDVINAGVGNYNTAMEVEYFLHRGQAFNPNIVVLNYFINDAEPTPTYNDPSWLARNSYAYAIIGGAWDGLSRRALGASDWREYYAGLYADDAPGWRVTRDSIAKLAEYCREHDIRLIISHIPELRELAPYPFAQVTAKLEMIAESHGIEFVDLMSALEGRDPRALWVTEPDPHPNAIAHSEMGKYLATYISGNAHHLVLKE